MSAETETPVEARGRMLMDRSTRAPISLLLSAALLFCFGCPQVTVTSQDVTEAAQDFEATVTTQGELSQTSRQYLRMHNLDAASAADPAALFASIQQTEDDDRLTKLHTLAEYALKVGFDLGDSSPEAAGDWFLLAASRAYQGFFLALGTGRAAWDFRSSGLREFYRVALAAFVLAQRERGIQAFDPHTRVVLGEKYSVSIAEGEHLVDPNDFEELLLSWKLAFEGLSNRHRRSGLAVPFVGFSENKRQQPAERYYSSAGIVKGLSALLTFTPGSDETSMDASLAFYDSRDAESATVDGVTVHLAADYTAPLGYLLSKVEGNALNTSGTFDPEASLGEMGFTMTEPYDPGRIPVITIHGLFSHPLTWIDVQNDLMADPVIRRHYQVWHFAYPPGLAVLESARLFRDETDELLAFLDPERKSEMMKSIVIVSHSMGGLIAKTVVADSGHRVAEAFFQVPFEELEISPEDREEIRAMMFFEPKPYVQRVVFTSVPHRGSHIPDNFIGWTGRALTSAPGTISALTERMRSSLPPGSLTREAEESTQEEATAIKNLSPHDPAMKGLSELTIDPGVPFHSIIGDQGVGNGEEGTDGVVAYKSAHLDGAESELIVPAGHGAHVHPLAILELKRILKLHLVELGLH